MSRIAFIFPGQGAQRAGMARAFYDSCAVSRSVFAAASEAAGFSVEDICFTENDRIDQTRYTQPALLTAECAILKAVEEAGIRADMAAGLSLGEYGALTACGVFSVPEAVRIVCQRGIYMEEAVPPGKGGMTAIISRKPLAAEEICAAVEGQVSVANYNCPGQQVITGEREAVAEAAKRLLAAGAMRAVPLNVSGPFHSPMLAEAGKKLRALLETAELARPSVPFVSNVTAGGAREPEEIRDLLGRQVCSPVLWQQSVAYMIRAGADTFVEIGPGRTLGNLVRKIDRTVRVFQVETPEELAKLKEEL